jgi:hypothetical protein
MNNKTLTHKQAYLIWAKALTSDDSATKGTKIEDLSNTPKNIAQFPILINGKPVGSIIGLKASASLKRALAILKRANFDTSKNEVSVGDGIREDAPKASKKKVAKKAKSTAKTPKAEKPKREKKQGLCFHIRKFIKQGIETGEQMTAQEIAEAVGKIVGRTPELCLPTVRAQAGHMRKEGLLPENVSPYKSAVSQGVSARVRELADGTRSAHEIAEVLVEEFSKSLKSAKSVVHSIGFSDRKKGLPTNIISERERIRILSAQLSCQEI